MDEQFYIRVRGRVQGPFSTGQLHSMAKRGQFSRLHEVSGDGNAWSKAGDHPNLFPAPTAAVRAPARTVQMASDNGHGSQPTLLQEPEGGEQIPLAEPAALAEWFYSSGGQQSGPIEFNALKALIASGQMRPDDLVWKAGMPNWLPAHQIAGLCHAPPVAAPATVWAPAGAQAAAAAPVELRTSGMAVAAVVLGILAAALATGSVVLAVFVGPAISIGGCLASLFVSILAVIFGHSGLKQIRRAPERVTGAGLAITGLVMAYLVLAAATIITLLLAAIVFLAIEMGAAAAS